VAHRDEAVAMVAAKRAYLAKKKIRAPITGTLGIRKIDLGDYLAPGSQVVTLQSLDPMFVDFRLPERYVARLGKGQAVDLSVQSQPGKAYRAKVTAIDPAVDSATRMVKVRARLPNPDNELRPGMFAEVKVIEETSDEVLVVPESAITYTPYGNSVFLIEEDKGTLKVNRRAVTTGEVRAGFVALSEGVKAGDRVVAVGQNRLRNGLAVEVVPAP
jgi:membrane fusion protein (multidrug efflux system)